MTTLLESCQAVMKLESVALGVGAATIVIQCQVTGRHKIHRAIAYGQPFEWMDSYDMALSYEHGGDNDSASIIKEIRASLQARLEGRNEGGDTEVMRLVDKIVKKEAKPWINTGDRSA